MMATRQFQSPQGWQRSKFGLLVPGVRPLTRPRPLVPPGYDWERDWIPLPDGGWMPVRDYSFAISTSGTPATGNGTTSPITVSWTAPGNTDEILLVAVGARQPSGGTPSVTSVTYNGVAMTLIDSQQNTTIRVVAALYWLAAPASGAHNVSAAISGTLEWAYVRAFGLQGAHQTTLDATATKGEANGADNISVSHTIGHANAWLFNCCASNSNPPAARTHTLDLNQTAGSDDFFGTQYGGPLSVGAVAVGWSTGDAGQGWAEVTGSIQLAGGAATTRGSPFDIGNAFGGGRTFAGPMR